MIAFAVGPHLAVHKLRIVLLIAAMMAMVQPSAAQETADGDVPDINTIQVGIANHFKVGHWTPIEISVNGLTPLKDPHVVVSVADNDGVPTTAIAPLPQPTVPDGDRSAIVYTNVGRLGTSIHVALAAGATPVETQSLKANAVSTGDARIVELPATAELLLFLGTSTPELTDGFNKRNEANGQLARKAARVESAYDLPRDWLGYDAVDLVILTADNSNMCLQLASDEMRFAALLRWIEFGGRLVIFCGGENAQELLGEGRPLASLLPGKLADVVRLPETGRLEHFAGSEVSIGGRGGRVAIGVPRLVDVQGNIEVHEGRQATALPLVVRAPRGLGEIAFVGVDPTKPPLAEWAGRAAFIQAVLQPYLDDDSSGSGTQKLVTRGYNDLSGALRQRLGRSFTGVAPIAFSLVTVFAVAYLLVLGPLDYFVVRRWFKRTLAAWFTFPLIVLLFGGLALALADRRQGGGELRINQLELVDIDMISGQARGTVWSTVYSPAAKRLDLRYDVEQLSVQAKNLSQNRPQKRGQAHFAPKTTQNEPVPDGSAIGSENAQVRLHSWALPGAGIGGTQSGGLNLAISGGGYRYADDFQALIGVPILTSGTKSLLARWTAPVGPLVVAELADEDGLVAGSIENRTGRELRNVRLFYKEWGYRLDTLTDGARIVVGEEILRSVKTIVTQDSLPAAARSQPEEKVFVAERASLQEIMNVMMFYEAAGGFGFAQLPNRFQAYCDLSRLSVLGRAVLVADVETAGSRLVDRESGEPIGEENSAAVIYRFVLPVRSE